MTRRTIGITVTAGAVAVIATVGALGSGGPDRSTLDGHRAGVYAHDRGEHLRAACAPTHVPAGDDGPTWVEACALVYGAELAQR